MCIHIIFLIIYFSDDATAKIKIKGVFEKHNGERYLRVNGFDVQPTNVVDFKIEIKGLFPDEQMSEYYCQINKIITA